MKKWTVETAKVNFGRVMENESHQRYLMVQNQLRSRGITDERVLRVMEELPRHDFIPSQCRSEAYLDQPVSIGWGQTISQPYIVALMTEKLHLASQHEVLEVGTGCGYQTAILARLVHKVYTIELRESLARQGRDHVERQGITNAKYYIGDGWKGWPEPRQFDRVLVAAAAEKIPAALLEQLAEGGRMVIPVGKMTGQKLLLVTKKNQQVEEKNLCYCRFVKLQHEGQQ